MSINQAAIGELVEPTTTWNPSDEPSQTFHYIDLSAVDQDAKRIVAPRTLLGKEAPSRARQLVSKGDILVSTVRPNLNGVAVVSAELDGATASTGFCVLRTRPDLLDSGYLFHWVKSPQFVADMTRKATGASYPAVSDKIIFESKLPLPVLEEQRRIAELLDRAEALRAKRRAALAQLDTLTSSIFLDLSQKSQSELREYELSDLAVAERGAFVNGPFGSNLLTSELKDDGVPVIYIRDIRDGEYKRVSTAFISERKARDLAVCSVIPGDVLVAKVGDPPGVAAVYPNHEPLAVVTQDVIRIRAAADRVLPEFLAAFLNSSLGRHKISHITIQATRARFSLGRFKQTTIPLPPVNIQGQFVRAASAIEKLRTFHRSALKEVESLIVALQARAFRGELFAPSGVLSELAAGVP